MTTQSTTPTLFDLVTCWNAAHPEAPLDYHPPLSYPTQSIGDRLPLFGHVSLARPRVGSTEPVAVRPEPGPWRDAWGSARIVGASFDRMQARLRPDGDIDIRRRRESGTWGEPEVCSRERWADNGWLLVTDRPASPEAAVATWNAARRIGDSVRYWPAESGGLRAPIDDAIAGEATVLPVLERAVVQLAGAGLVALSRIEPSF